MQSTRPRCTALAVLLAAAGTKPQIERELFRSPHAEKERVSVVVEDGITTLAGTVGSLHERGEATQNALEGGAYRARNRLTLSAD